MKKLFLGILLLTLPVVSNISFADNEAVESGKSLIKQIVFSGFMLKDKKPIENICRSNQNKRLSREQIEKIVNDIKVIYLEAGYAGLVEITYKIKKERLIVTILLLNR